MLFQKHNSPLHSFFFNFKLKPHYCYQKKAPPTTHKPREQLEPELTNSMFITQCLVSMKRGLSLECSRDFKFRPKVGHIDPLWDKWHPWCVGVSSFSYQYKSERIGYIIRKVTRPPKKYRSLPVKLRNQ